MTLKPALIQNFKSDHENISIPQDITLAKPPYDENWLQNLIHKHPSLVPAAAVEACFEDIVPIVRELPLASGYLDNLYFTPSGYPVLVEVKLWKNQEARRKVVAQILEYAKDFSHLTYQDLNAEIQKILKHENFKKNPLYEIVSSAAPDTLDEITFVDRVSRNMREGRFLLLIIGDGIREDMASLANYLMHHSLRYTFGIVQIKLFTLPDGSILALPDVMAKTQTIERHVTIVTMNSDNAHVKEGREAEKQIVKEHLERTSLSLDDFFDAMNKTAPDSVSWLKDFIQSLSDISIEPRIGKNGDTLMLRSPRDVTLMYIAPPTVAFWGLADRFKKSIEGMEVSKEFLTRLAKITGGEVKVFPAGGMDVRLNGKSIPLTHLIGKEQDLKDILRETIEKTSTLEDTD